MIILHHLNQSRSHRILWALEELQCPYEVREYKRDPKTLLAPKELKSLHPLGKSPLVEVKESGEVLAESAAILLHLADLYDASFRFHPKQPSSDWTRFRYWMHYAEGSAMSPLLLKLVFQQVVAKAPLPIWPAAKAIQFGIEKTYIHPELKSHLQFWEHELGRTKYFAGAEFSFADIMMSYPLEVAQSRFGTRDYPKIESFIDSIRARPAYQKAIEIGGPVVLS